jgi:hypothetical protein
MSTEAIAGDGIVSGFQLRNCMSTEFGSCLTANNH